MLDCYDMYFVSRFSLVDNPQILSVITGVSDINDIDRQLRYVSEVILHPEYNFIFNADIALLRLQKPLDLDNNTQTICLPWDKRQFSPSDLCFITGYGVSDMKGSPPLQICLFLSKLT